MRIQTKEALGCEFQDIEVLYVTGKEDFIEDGLVPKDFLTAEDILYRLDYKEVDIMINWGCNAGEYVEGKKVTEEFSFRKK